ncbi:hypothetical protein KVP09_03050 [Alcaligenaceae bacterium CGII-47]|nr:hypothetical protein [Alcaligenaceae bacterium CGII-47]
MMSFSWMGFFVGLLAGCLFSMLFFAGLAWGMKIALRRANPAAVLFSSAALRIAAVLAGGWAVATWLGVAGALGFAVAFIVLRTVLLAWLRGSTLAQSTSWN